MSTPTHREREHGSLPAWGTTHQLISQLDTLAELDQSEAFTEHLIHLALTNGKIEPGEA